jgi:hypothetical protein
MNDTETVRDEHTDLWESASAIFNQERTHRYVLTRRWADAAPAVFIMLNPSTADAFQADPTVRRCLSFAKREGAGGLTVLNLFALRSTDPAALRTHSDPIGPLNDVFIRTYTDHAELVIAAWGVHGQLNDRDQDVVEMLHGPTNLLCLGVTKDGLPKHPLYVPGNAPLQTYTSATRGAA